MKGLLLAGGHGTRLRPLTFTGNKHLLPVANRPMILYGLQHLRECGIREIGVILGPLKEGVVELLGDGSSFGVEITYIDQPEPKGLAHAALVAEAFLGHDSFVMYLGDNLLKQGARPLRDRFESGKNDCVIGVTKVSEPNHYGVVQFDAQNRIIKLVEKPKSFVSPWALIGVYVFNRRIFDIIRELKPSRRGELEITDAIQKLHSQGGSVAVQFVEGWWKDTGRPEDLLEANQLVLRDLEPSNKATIELGATVTGTVSMGEGTTVLPGSRITGPAIIGDECTIGPRSYIGPYTSVGSHAIIEQSEVENSIIMENATIRNQERIVDSIIGRGVRILRSDGVVPKGHKLIVGDAAFVSI